MKTKQLFWKSAGLVAGCLLGATLNVSALVLYDNLTTDKMVDFNPIGREVGDEIILGGTYDNVLATEFSFRYWTSDPLDPNARAKVRFYLNDGPASSSGPLTPGATPFYDSGLFTLTCCGGTGLLYPNVLVPHTFTWTIQFFNLGYGTAGIEIWSPPTIGNNYTDFWMNVPGTGWELRTSVTGLPMDFGARLSSNVPEGGSTAAMAFVGIGIIGVFQVLQRKRSQPA